MKFDIYSRKSKFTGKGESIENQIELCKNYILREFPNTKEEDIFIFEDEGFSAKNLKRPQFQEMIKHQNRENIDYVVVYRLDRISRNVSDFSNLLEDFKTRNIGFISINEKFDTSTPMGRAMITIAAIFAQLERETIAERIRDNMMMLARTGRWLGGNAPLGYTSEKIETIKADGKTRSYFRLKISKDESELVKLIFNKFLELQTLTGVERYLVKNGIKNANGNYIRTKGIKDILSHPVYCVADEKSYKFLEESKCQLYCNSEECNGKYGFSTYNRTTTIGSNKDIQKPTKVTEWIIAVGKHKPLISSEDWIKVNCILGKLKPCIDRKVRNPLSLLSGLVKCGKCGSTMRPKPVSYYNGTDKEGTFDYFCELKARGTKQKCNCANVNGNNLDKAVCNELLKFDDNNSLIGQQFSQLKNSIKQQSNIQQDEINKLKQLLEEKQQSIQNLVLSMTKITSDTAISYIQKEIDTMDLEIKNINKQISSLENTEDFNTVLCENFLNVQTALITLKDQFSSLSIVEKRDLMKQIIDKVVWDGNGNLNIFIKGVL